MATRKRRYTEARLWMAWGALALLVASWAGVAVQDRLEEASDKWGAGAGESAFGRVTQVQPQTRTRGS